MSRIVITGGPGAGKTTLLLALQARGYTIVSDSPRTIIQDRPERAIQVRCKRVLRSLRHYPVIRIEKMLARRKSGRLSCPVVVLIALGLPKRRESFEDRGNVGNASADEIAGNRIWGDLGRGLHEVVTDGPDALWERGRPGQANDPRRLEVFFLHFYAETGLGGASLLKFGTEPTDQTGASGWRLVRMLHGDPKRSGLQMIFPLSHPEQTYAITNNHNLGKAVVNALELKSLLGLKLPSLPEHLIHHYPGSPR